MQEAIDKGFLCHYDYYPHVVSLTPEEMNEYKDLSLQIAKYCHGGELDTENERLKRLLLERKRIIHKAAGKIDVFKQIMEGRLQDKGNLKYTLVYVPEGILPDNTANLFAKTDIISDDPEAEKLIDQYTEIVRDLGSRITVKKFTSNTSDRDAILSDFASGKIQVLTSMKCLDEGVDVPRSELAVFALVRVILGNLFSEEVGS